MRSGSVSLEFTLLLPIVILLFGIAAQYFMFSHSRLYVQQAAYAAARSALVHKCPPQDLSGLLENPASGIAAGFCSDDPNKWIDAARWHLIPAAPSSEFAQARELCPRLEAAETLLRSTQLPQDLDAAFHARLCYAFEPDNVEVTVSWDRLTTGSLVRNGRLPMTATVRFKYPVTTPIGRFLSDGVRDDGTKWRWGEATVTIL